jgi:RNA polymerase sigma factor (sigma-70 family)
VTPVQINRLWQEYYPKVYGYFYRRLDNRQDVEDLTSVTLGAFLDQLDQKDIANPPAFLWKIAHNQLLVWIRNKSRKPMMVSFDEAFHVSTQDEVEYMYSPYLKERKTLLLDCIAKHANPEEQLLMERLILEDERAVDMAKDLGLKPETIRQRLSRCFKKLRVECKKLWLAV